MDDQANGLRRLVGQRQPSRKGSPQSGPRLILLTGGKGGTGTTTIAVGLATAAAQCGCEILLVDANRHGGDVATLCQVDEPWTIADVLSSRATAGDAIRQGPRRLRVLPGAWGQENLDETSDADHRRLIEQLRVLRPAADYIIVDGGAGSGRALSRFWEVADSVVAVTTAESNAVMDTYASIKLLARRGNAPCVSALVNRAPSPRAAEEVYDRLARSCRRFLEVDLDYAGYVSERPRWFGRPVAGSSLMVTAGRTGRQIRRIAEELMSVAGGHPGESQPSGPPAAERMIA
ncbi:MAG: MinD/ParA family protein [Rhodopirellula sp.]|nr:MinD/ParA family protein [Rhodopirellula sp.]